ncbi:MAG: DUF2877 domain-containing protein [Spirochaetota bacterium]|jgi:hypothetical protein|nr:DUF2877 domain-containing protein [Spirochaetota bacterium]
MKPAEQAQIVSMGRAIAMGRYPVCARFAHYLDFKDGDDIIGLTDMRDEGGAHTLVLAGLRAGWTARAAELIVGSDAVVFDGQIFARDELQLFRDKIHAAALPHTEQMRRLGIFRDTILEHAAPLSMAVVLDSTRRENFQGNFARALCDRFLEGAAACAMGEYARAAALLQGVGYGLTPSGDDFLCGVMLALHHSGDAHDAQELADALTDTLSRSAFMARTFLRDAIAGRWPRRLRDAAESLHGAGQDNIIRSAVIRALDHGASSGADLASGFIYTALHQCAQSAASRDLVCA